MAPNPGRMDSDNAQVRQAGGSSTGGATSVSTQRVASVTDLPTKELGHGGNSILPWMDIVDIYEDVPELAWPQSNMLWEKMRRDAQLEAILRALVLPIRRYKWHIDPNGASDAVTQEIAEDFGLPILGRPDENQPRSRLRNRFSHDDHIRHAFLALNYGHMFFEQFGIVDESNDFKFRLRKLAPRMPGTIMKIRVARDGGLIGIVQYPAGYGPDNKTMDDPNGIPIAAGRIVAYINEREGGNWVGRSVYRSVYKNWLVKDRLIRVDALKHERNGMGVPVAEAPPNASKDQMRDLSAMAQNWMAGEMSGAAIPNGAKMTLQGVQGSTPDTIASIRYHDQQMARIFLEMFMDLGTTSSGSRALSTSFIEFFDFVQEAYAEWYSVVTTAHVIEDIVDWNYGENEPAPRLVYAKPKDKSLAIADLVNLVNSGAITMDTETEQWLRDQYVIPQLVGERPAPVAPIAPFGGQEGGGTGPTPQPQNGQTKASIWAKVKAALLEMEDADAP